MNTFVAPFNAYLPDVAPADDGERLSAGVNPVRLNDLIHELRQPLGVIESLTCFIDLTTTDEKIRTRLEHIQEMLKKVHYILEGAIKEGASPAPVQFDREHK